jgi:NAD(P)-dependent dehydrogenase (short-subunit alcohol dehydrogenase family)
MNRLKGKVALVTGAGQGIGKGIALAFAAEGADVALVGRTESKLAETAAEIKSRGRRAVCFSGDVADAARMDAAVAATVDRLGGLHVLVNNAQHYCFGSVNDMSMQDLEAGWNSGAIGALNLMRAAYQHLRNGGVVINISSSAAYDPSPRGIGGYAAVKAAINSLSRAAALEWSSEGIRVLTLVPFARTPAVAAVLDANPGVEEGVLSQVPMGRFGDTEKEIGRAAVFAASSDASFLTGTSLAVDGGSTYFR